MIGRVLGSYRIVEQIGRGGMATVYKGYDPNTERYVAVKVLPQQFSDDPQFQERFKREAKAIAKLEHIHILPIFAYGEEDGIAYMVMRYLEAGSLADHIDKGQLPFGEASRLLTQLAGALDHAHANGVLHRDMKPSNVLLDNQNNAYLMDFGIAKIVEATVDLTGDRMLGTPAYMSPEQCMGEKNLTPATDIYSLGIILYEMVTGKRPFHAETPIAVILQQLNDPLPMPHELRPDLSSQAEGVILKALAKEPESRYPTASDFAAAFAHAISIDQTLMAPPPAADSQGVVQKDMDSTQVYDVGPTQLDLPKPTPSPPSRSYRWVWGVMALLLVAASVWGATQFPGLFSQETAVSPATELGFVESGMFLLGMSDDGATLCDVDEDGDLDVLITNVLYINESGTFVDSLEMPELPGHVRALVSADLNGDGATDLFFAREQGQGGGLVWLNDGTGRFQDTGQLLEPDDSWAATSGDLDNDGDIDLLIAGTSDYQVWLNDGSGTFQSGTTWPMDRGVRGVELADLNNDGILDLFTASCSVWLNNGAAEFNPSRSPTCDSDNVALELGDIDNDGDLDALIGNATNRANLVWLNDGTGRFTDSNQRLGNSSTEAVVLVDLDRDGDLDAVTGNTTEQGSDSTDHLWINDGTGRFTLSPINLGANETSHIVAGDLNADGFPDLLLSGPEASSIWFNASK